MIIALPSFSEAQFLIYRKWEGKRDSRRCKVSGSARLEEAMKRIDRKTAINFAGLYKYEFTGHLISFTSFLIQVDFYVYGSFLACFGSSMALE